MAVAAATPTMYDMILRKNGGGGRFNATRPKKQGHVLLHPEREPQRSYHNSVGFYSGLGPSPVTTEDNQEKSENTHIIRVARNKSWYSVSPPSVN